MERFDWDPEKSQWLERTRNVGFEDAVFHIQNGNVLDIIERPNPSRYPGQRIFVLEMAGYAYLVPFVEQEEEGGVFLKTIIPSRKATREYLK